MTPRAIEELTGAWLSEALGTPVSVVRAEVVGAESGFASSIARLHLRGGDGTGVPATMIAKLPAVDERGAIELAAKYRTEAVVYSRLADGLGPRIPRCYGVWHDEAGDGIVLLLEDLATGPGIAFGSVTRGCSRDEAEAVVDALAALHATWWRSPRLAAEPSIARFGVIGAQLERIVARRDVFFERHGDLVPEPVARFTRSAGPRWTAPLEALESAPETLVHIDTHLDNIAFARGDGGVEAILFDWQNASRGCAALDVAQLIPGSLTIEHRRAEEAALLHRYHAALCARGVAGHPFDQLVAHYRAAQLRWWIGTVNGLGSDYATHWSEAAVASTRVVVERRATALADAMDDFAALVE